MRFLRAFAGTALLQARHRHQEGPVGPRGDDRDADGIPGHILQRHGGVAGAVLGLPRAVPLPAGGLLHGKALLLQTANHFWHLKYAEILWTMAEPVLTLKEFCKVVELQTDHVRGFY